MQEQANNNDDLMAKMVQAIQPIVDQQFECMGFAGQLAGRVAQLEARVEQKLDKILAEMKMVKAELTRLQENRVEVGTSPQGMKKRRVGTSTEGNNELPNEATCSSLQLRKRLIIRVPPEQAKRKKVTAPPTTADAVRLIPLPDARWDAEFNSENLEISEGLRIKSKRYEPGEYHRTCSELPFDAAIAATALLSGLHALYYFEVEILEMIEPDDVYIGFAGGSSQLIAFGPLGGVLTRPSDDWEEYGSGFKKGDFIGCGLIVPPKNGTIDGKKAQAFLTINGLACKNIAIDGVVDNVWPFAGLGSIGTMVEPISDKTNISHLNTMFGSTRWHELYYFRENGGKIFFMIKYDYFSGFPG